MTYQASKLFHFVDQRQRYNSATVLSVTAECTTTYATTKQGIVNNSIFYNNFNHNSLRVYGNSKLNCSLWELQIYGTHTHTRLYKYIRERSIISISVAYLWRNICTVLYTRFIFLNDVAACNICYCKLLQYGVRLALCVFGTW